MATSLAEIALFTEDVERLVEFYGRVLDRAPDSNWSGGATFELDGVTLLIHVATREEAGAPANRDHFALRVDDVDAEAARLGTEARDYDWGRSAYLVDSDGRMLELQ
jgi:predicted enzyme related to lactoylglutathione lyase